MATTTYNSPSYSTGAFGVGRGYALASAEDSNKTSHPEVKPEEIPFLIADSLLYLPIRVEVDRKDTTFGGGPAMEVIAIPLNIQYSELCQFIKKSFRELIKSDVSRIRTNVGKATEWRKDEEIVEIKTLWSSLAWSHDTLSNVTVLHEANVGHVLQCMKSRGSSDVLSVIIDI